MTVFGITYRRLAIDGHVAAIRCQQVDPTRGLIGSAHEFTTAQVADRVERGDVFEFWPRIEGVRMSGGGVQVVRNGPGGPRLVEERAEGPRLTDLPPF